MPGGVDQVELEVLPGPIGVWQGDGVALDGNAPFTLEIHGVQDLFPEIPGAYQTGVLDEAVGQGGFPVIDVGNDAEVTGLAHISPSSTPEYRAASIAGEFVHLSHSGEEVNPMMLGLYPFVNLKLGSQLITFPTIKVYFQTPFIPFSPNAALNFLK